MALLLSGTGFRGFAQNVLPFDEALQNMLTYLADRISSGSTVAVLSFQSEYPNLSEYVIDEITSGLVNTDLYTVVDRRSLELLAQEMAFQLSGEVSDETALAIGRRLGAQMVISGAVSYLGEFYRLRVQAIEVETARIQGSQTITIQPNRLLANLTGIPWAAPAEPVYVPPVAAAPEQTTPEPAAPTRPPARRSNAPRFNLGWRGGYARYGYEPSEFWDSEFLPWEYYPVHTSAVDFSALMSLQIFDFFAVQTEAAFIAGDTFATHGAPWYPYYVKFSYSAITVPLLGKITLRPGSFLLAGFGGVYITIPVTAMTFTVYDTGYSYNIKPPLGYIAGGNIGIKLGPGTLFLDIRYTADFDAVNIYGDWGERRMYKRNMASYSLGYEFGFGGRRGN
jgi:TolB-like protein